VNVASQCGYTKQYAGLQSLHEKYRPRGLVVLGFPANNFGNQEPGTNDQIKQFCSVNFGVTFPMLAKISVKGQDIHPLYRYLTAEETNPGFAGDISWNFNKFLVDRLGTVVGRYGSEVEPLDPKLVADVEEALSLPAG
jgi:glutathione peroxidase